MQLSSVRGLGSLVFEGALYLSAHSNQGNTVYTCRVSCTDQYEACFTPPINTVLLLYLCT